MRPEYNDKFIEAHLMGPVAFVAEPRQPIFRILVNLYTILKKTFEMLRIYKITFDNRIGIKVAEMFCRKSQEVNSFQSFSVFLSACFRVSYNILC